ncbi:hypothetical protein [Pseudonocardia sp. ICBG1142]|uniref:hypothetical protein n=1 Tax=Pseudonocardia sp. ICBG1142 TaxID=2846760 RepID=UPI001CF6D7A6|nr:hypothetical protein [Pseudonocardia sp. ICBG1142]
MNVLGEFGDWLSAHESVAAALGIAIGAGVCGVHRSEDRGGIRIGCAACVDAGRAGFEIAWDGAKKSVELCTNAYAAFRNGLAWTVSKQMLVNTWMKICTVT